MVIHKVSKRSVKENNNGTTLESDAYMRTPTSPHCLNPRATCESRVSSHIRWMIDFIMVNLLNRSFFIVSTSIAVASIVWRVSGITGSPMDSSDFVMNSANVLLPF